LSQAAVDRGFEKIFISIGSTMIVFLSNLNRLFLKLQLCMDLPEYATPDFRVEKATKTSLELHYRSRRPMPSFIEGLCEEVGERFFNIKVKFKILKDQQDGTCDHEVYYLS
jgi:hypothetical protein